ncbi:diguanylate cyclase [Thauera sp. 2A1]|uniref:diguanylate cyclase n=1 Tax=Thauera sp. 2A1 TaxID=2570191 RepID=UPI0012922C51|nr:diguanylate cyclase [Thauera sp. 2A1]KAI5913436.1 diguanylate cyclase [Thauera sp. 2A1]
MSRIRHASAALMMALSALWLLPGTHPAAAASGDTDLTIGVVKNHSPDVTLRQMQTLADYLSAGLGDTRVSLRVMDLDEIDAASARHQLDFLLTSPSQYVQLKRRNGLSGALATLVAGEGGKPLSAIGGAIVVRADRNDIRTLADLATRRIAAAAPQSLGGYQAQLWALHDAGLPLPNAGQIEFAGLPQDRVVDLVLRGKADAGFVLGGIVEEMVRNGRLEPDALKFINAQALPDYPYTVSTYLYPQAPFVVLPHVSESLSRRVAALLLSMPAQPDGSGNHYAFTIPADYAGVEEIMRELRLPPFDTLPRFGLHDVWHQYQWEMLAASSAAFVIATLVLMLLLRNREIRYMAQHDALTGLANRALFTDLVASTIAAARRDHGVLALLLIDLDHFKSVNDTLGHAAGDVVLAQFASRLRSAIRESDTAARIGGDEFMVLLRNVHDAADALRVAEKIRAVSKQPVVTERQTVTLSVSIGVALYPEHGSGLEDLSRRADEAMYQMKTAGRDAVALYRPAPPQPPADAASAA